MEIHSNKIVVLNLTEHDAFMLESIMGEFIKSRAGSACAGDSFDKFATNAQKMIKDENEKKI